jgi:hypothetical protein
VIRSQQELERIQKKRLLLLVVSAIKTKGIRAMKKGERLSEAYSILNKLILNFVGNENITKPEVINELVAIGQHATAYSRTVNHRDYTDDYPLNNSDDVTLCPRCGDQDVLPEHRVCFSCAREMTLDNHA